MHKHDSLYFFVVRGIRVIFSIPDKNNKGCCAHAQQPLLFQNILWMSCLMARIVIAAYYADIFSFIALIALLNCSISSLVVSQLHMSLTS